MTAAEDRGVQVEARTLGCADLCGSCNSAVKTFANLQVVGDEKYLIPRWMPPGGCTCTLQSTDPSCPLCSKPDAYLCRPCGDTDLVTLTNGGDES